ncbi:uncharacterized protein LOC131825449 [Mustela lutreola]|uniref:uncharacterized protein LOC131825449 n=1 Tax=Mustela lutreola TaxID=9666 RepID=UPI0027974392|nr:uncharacterized protein LOC131825449 [Mustela lutreola]
MNLNRKITVRTPLLWSKAGPPEGGSPCFGSPDGHHVTRWPAPTCLGVHEARGGTASPMEGAPASLLWREGTNADIRACAESRLERLDAVEGARGEEDQKAREGGVCKRHWEARQVEILTPLLRPTRGTHHGQGAGQLGRESPQPVGVRPEQLWAAGRSRRVWPQRPHGTTLPSHRTHTFWVWACPCPSARGDLSQCCGLRTHGALTHQHRVPNNTVSAQGNCFPARRSFTVWPLPLPPLISCHTPLAHSAGLGGLPVVPQAHRLEFTTGPLHLLSPDVDPRLFSSSCPAEFLSVYDTRPKVVDAILPVETWAPVLLEPHP